MRAIFRTLVLAAMLIAGAVVLNEITPLRDWARALEQNPEPYKTITITLSIIGWGLFLLALVIGFVLHSRPMSSGAARDFMQRETHGRFRGRAAGREFHSETTMREIKRAVGSGEWREPKWYPILLGLAALPLIAFGMFGFFIVVAPPVVKVLCIAALFYATARTVWSFWHA